MKCNSETALAEKRWRKIIETMEDNVIILLQVLHEEFGFGEERQNRVLTSILRKAEEFNDAIDDDVLDIKTDYERALFHDKVHDLIRIKSIGVVPKEIYDCFYNTPMQTNAAVRRECKMKERQKNAISLKQAAELQQNMLAAKRYVESHSNGGISNA